MGKASDEFVRQLNNQNVNFNLNNGNIAVPSISLNCSYKFSSDLYTAECRGKKVLEGNKTEFSNGVDEIFALTEAAWKKRLEESPAINPNNANP